MLKKIYFSLLLIILLLGNLVAQERKLEYSQNLTITEGMAHNGVTSVLEDSKGYLWVGTYDGLNRYDGYEFKEFKNTLEQELLVSNRVRTLLEDHKGNLWIGTDEGISIYNYSQERFINIYSNKLVDKGASGPVVLKFIQNKETGVVLATFNRGVLVFKDDYTLLQSYRIPKKIHQKNNIIFDGIAIDKTNYMFATSNGLLLFNIESGSFTGILQSDIRYSSSLVKLGENFLLATIGKGVAIIEWDNKDNTYAFKLNHKDLMSYRFYCSSIDLLGNLWLGREVGGIIHINNASSLENRKVTKKMSLLDETGLIRVSSFCSTSTYGCWVGTYNDGLFRFNTKENPFKYHDAWQEDDLHMRLDNVRFIFALDDHRVYMNSLNSGLTLFNTKKQQFENLPFDMTKEAQSKVDALFLDSGKNLWLKLGENMGFYRVRAGKRKLEKITHTNASLLNPLEVRSIKEDKYGNIWLGGTEGLFKISMNNNGDIIKIELLNDILNFENEKNIEIRYIYQDPIFDFIWLGTAANGLFRLPLLEDGTINKTGIKQFVKDKIKKNALSSNFVTSILRLPDGDLWIGTERGGICQVINSDKEPEFIAYSEQQGLSNNVVKNIVYDAPYLWVTTNIGLNRFNPKNHRFRKFKNEDGLPFEDFGYPGVKLGNENLIFSCLKGFCYFNPKDLPKQESLPRFEFGDLKVYSKSFNAGDSIGGRVLLEKRLAEMDEILLKHDENVFTIELKSLHFSSPDNHRLKYQLLPVNEEWIEVTSDQRFISYNALPYGEYRLRVMASNSLDRWTAPKELKIIISPPFWKTNTAFILYVILIGLIVGIIVSVILRIQALNYNLKIEKLEKNTVKEVNAAKLRFFSNISHEIKTPITLISGPVAQMADRYKGNPDLTKKLELVKRQSKKISQLVDQVHDFQRSDANQLKMNPTHFCFNTFIQYLVADFEFLAETDKKLLESIEVDSQIYVLADRDKMEKIFNNLLNNAFKYTDVQDTISISYKRDHENLIVSVSDTGKGIDAEDLPHIFERFYQSQRKDSIYSGGSGIGLAFTKRLVEMHYGNITVLSELGKGTTMTVYLPVVKDKPSDSEQEMEQEILSAEEEYQKRTPEFATINPTDIKNDEEFSGAHIFLAEDNTDMRQFVTDILSNFFQVTAFKNGKECLNALEGEWPDLIISDVLMPVLNGLDLCRKVKTDIKTSHLPVILLTACTSVEDQVQGLTDGADAYIKKPFDTQYLVTRIESLLRSRKQLRERFQIDLPLTLKKKDENNQDHIFLEQLYRLMEENLDNQELDVNSLAKELYLSRTYFYQKVKAITNHTPYDLLRAFRMKKAAQFLAQDKLSVNEVYIMTGFKSRSHFSRLFKETYGISPGKYGNEMISRNS